MPKVSVIVPVYNVEQYLVKCLDSLVNQTLEDIEIIVVNDGTKDNSQAIVDDFLKKHPHKIKSYVKENGGLSSARNFGFKKAISDYVAFVDSDDCIEVTMYEKLYQKAQQDDFDMVMCDFNEIREGNKHPCSCKLDKDIHNRNEVKEAMIDFYPSAWNKLFKKELLINTQTFFKEDIWFEDVEFMYRLLPYVTKIGIVKEHFYNYLIRSGSITSTADPRIYHYIDNWNGILKFYHDKKIYDEYKEILEYCYVRYLFATFVKTSLKFDKKNYLCAVNKALENVQSSFPMYKKNKYMKQNNLKNIYLRFFSRHIAILFYYIKHI